jgi:hypothetical protein
MPLGLALFRSSKEHIFREIPPRQEEQEDATDDEVAQKADDVTIHLSSLAMQLIPRVV